MALPYSKFTSEIYDTETGLGAKLGFDATTKIPPETKREWGRRIEMSADVKKKVDEMWGKLGL